MNRLNYKLRVAFISATLSLGLNNLLPAQNLFTVSADTVFAVKSSNYFVFYDYIEFGNNTADTLHMRWKKVETISSNPGEPGNVWDIAIQDHVNFYNPANFLDSADFFIPTIPGSTDKFLLHLFPNDLTGHLVVKFQFYPVDNPSDSATVVFDYTVTEVVGVVEDFAENRVSVFPNPAMHFFQVSNQSGNDTFLSVFNSEGKMLASFQAHPAETKRVDCSSWPNGVYLLKVDCEGKSGWKRIMVNNN